MSDRSSLWGYFNKILNPIGKTKRTYPHIIAVRSKGVHIYTTAQSAVYHGQGQHP